MHRRGSNPSRENYGFFLMRWGSEARGAGENGVWKATRKGKMMGRGCFYQGGAGKKATKRGERAKICCLSPPVVGKKATKKGKLSEIRCFYRWQEARKATQKVERAKICCLSPPVVGKKATKKGKLSEIRCL